MTGDTFLIGSPVTVAAADEFYAFIDGWNGKVIGFDRGLVTVECIGEELQKLEFQVPPEQLRHNRS